MTLDPAHLSEAQLEHATISGLQRDEEMRIREQNRQDCEEHFYPEQHYGEYELNSIHRAGLTEIIRENAPKVSYDGIKRVIEDIKNARKFARDFRQEAENSYTFESKQNNKTMAGNFDAYARLATQILDTVFPKAAGSWEDHFKEQEKSEENK